MKTYTTIAIACASAVLALGSMTACGDDDGSSGTGGTGATPGAGGETPGAGGGTGGDIGEGGTGAGGTGGGDNMPDADFVDGGYGTDPVAMWKGYTFTVPDAVGGTITPDAFTGSNLCASGTTGASYDGFGIVGWNINQDVDEMGAGLTPLDVAVGGTGLSVNVVNNTPSTVMRIQLQTADEVDRWCAEVPPGGSGVIPWTSFAKECWTTGGAAFAAGTPIAQVQVQAVAGADPLDPSGDTGGATPFDFCVVTLSQD